MKLPQVPGPEKRLKDDEQRQVHSFTPLFLVSRKPSSLGRCARLLAPVSHAWQGALLIVDGVTSYLQVLSRAPVVGRYHRTNCVLQIFPVER